MKILPDAHALIWWLEGSERLSPAALELMNDEDAAFVDYDVRTAW